jgi:aspartate racemase
MKLNRALKLGIVGGLGARAGADLLNQLVSLTPVRSEGDHREIVFEQKPLIEDISVADRRYSPTHRKFYVFDALSRMEKGGCDAAVLPCFITHTFLEELRSELTLKLISMTEAIDAHLQRDFPDAKRIGVLTTGYVRRNGLFDELAGQNWKPIYPDETFEDAIMRAIYGPDGFKAGGRLKLAVEALDGAVANLISKGAEVIVPGMTEIPLILPNERAVYPVPILPSNEIYARYVLAQTADAQLKPFKIGVLGGVGPAATVDFMAKVVHATSAARDQDHIKMLVEQNPQIPDRTANLVGDGTDPTLALYSTAKKLERGGADIIAIPCNTAHAYVDRLQRHLDIPIVNMLTETAEHIKQLDPCPRVVGVLATSGTIASQLYQDALRFVGLEVITPDTDDQLKVMDAIYGTAGVKAGHTMGTCADQIAEVIGSLASRSADVVVLGCTELPLIQLPTSVTNSIRLIDPTKVLAERCVNLAMD